MPFSHGNDLAGLVGLNEIAMEELRQTPNGSLSKVTLHGAHAAFGEIPNDGATTIELLFPVAEQPIRD
jgi:hypothetical protein